MHATLREALRVTRDALRQNEPTPIMESHFRYEERQLLVVLEGLDLDAPIRTVLGPL